MKAGEKVAVGALGLTALTIILVAASAKPARAEGLASLLGKVTDQDGQPLAGVTVSLDGVFTQTDPTGYYDLTGLVPGTYVVDFNDPGYQPVEL
jgi:protocatechuate 3,4-dioxygenase beta subunit